MSKSTPISQLPSSKVPDDLMLDDDDATVQEVLNQISQSQSQPPQGQNGMMHQQEMMHQQQMQKFAQQMQMNPQLTPQQMFSQGPQMMPQDYVIPHPQQNSWSIMNNNTKPSLNIDVDMKIVFLVIAITAFVQIAPIQNIVYKYLSIDHIPYSSVMIKSVVAGLLFFFAKKYFG